MVSFIEGLISAFICFFGPPINFQSFFSCSRFCFYKDGNDNEEG